MSLDLHLQGQERPGYFWVHLFPHQSLTSSEFPREGTLFYSSVTSDLPQNLRGAGSSSSSSLLSE